MKISQSWKNAPQAKSNFEISDKYLGFFMTQLPEFFKDGVSLKQIREAMPTKLYAEYCKDLNITDVGNNKFIQEVKKCQK